MGMEEIFDQEKRRKSRMGPPLKPKERIPEADVGPPAKTLVILAKPQPEKIKNSQIAQNENAPSSPTRQVELKPPTVLLKTREGPEQEGSRAASPGAVSPISSQGTALLTGKETDVFADFVKTVAQRVYHVQQKPGQSIEGDQKLAPPTEMSSPVKLVDESLQWCDNAMEFLHDGSDFYVVGVLGLQGTGKSTVLSTISGWYDDEKKWQLFKPQTWELKELGEHCTTGIDMYVTNERIILLDTQPVLSASVMDHMIQYEKKALGGADYHSTENALQMQSLQLAAFLMAVCHTIITVQDWFIDLNYLRFLQSAEMLKPATPVNPHELNPIPEETTEYYPHIVFVQNKCHREDFAPTSITKMQKTLHSLFQKSKLKYSGSVNVDLFHRNDQENYHNVNLFLLPDKDCSDNDSLNDGFPEYKGHPGYQKLTESFNHQILSMPRNLLTHTALSEKNWFHYSARIWETVKKSNLFHEYNRLLP